ncbi:fumarylacetoacetate hydrolase family protein [Bacillus sp. mrc49]|uniref:fumarylacetoacetate hydrolase family protein n=1 Tax=Bacillus sp. mrc49 TaxID=2054913 RepID=UPI000C28050D|nr:fumarylacetoacetate hydrolase family protein [Bacillus sp. mrc49]PJN91700.1 fumarylacetoacetate hydrolase [Bacillus sp. mrc49]
MRIIRYLQKPSQSISLAAITEKGNIYSLPYNDYLELVEQAKNKSIKTVDLLNELIHDSSPLIEQLEELDLTVPIESPEVWAAGVTYQKSKEARNYETTNGKLDAITFYDKVYDAERPEIFLKSTKDRTIGPNEELFLRSDSNWQIPEPELGLVLGSDGEIIGYTIGNDLSCRDIEGENPLYLPQAKVWARSCSIGPAILPADMVLDPYQFNIICRIFRDEKLLFEGFANTSQLKRRYEELVHYLKRDNILFPGTVLLTGTCIVPPNEFTLIDGDRVEIEIPGIGKLNNVVKVQVNQTVN